jgi:hypothetical protein
MRKNEISGNLEDNSIATLAVACVSGVAIWVGSLVAEGMYAVAQNVHPTSILIAVMMTWFYVRAQIRKFATVGMGFSFWRAQLGASIFVGICGGIVVWLPWRTMLG